MTDNKTDTPSLTADKIISNILNSRGQFVRAVWKSEPKPAAKHKAVKLEKRTSAVVRSGIDFSNLSAVKVGIEEGTRGEVEPLPWGSWLQWPYVIIHNEAHYIRLYPSDTKSTTQYFVNGEQVEKAEFVKFLTPSEANKILSGEKPLCFTVKRDNILGIEDFLEG